MFWSVRSSSFVRTSPPKRTVRNPNRNVIIHRQKKRCQRSQQMFKILLRNNDTGEERLYVDDGDWTETTEFTWVEGNYSCDCNRSLFFARAAGEPDDVSAPCGMKT